jgi:hypothetical protein
MKKTIFPLLIFLLLTINFSLFGQNSESPNSRLNVLESLAKTNDRETKMLALDGFERVDRPGNDRRQFRKNTGTAYYLS